MAILALACRLSGVHYGVSVWYKELAISLIQKLNPFPGQQSRSLIYNISLQLFLPPWDNGQIQMEAMYKQPNGTLKDTV